MLATMGSGNPPEGTPIRRRHVTLGDDSFLIDLSPCAVVRPEKEFLTQVERVRVPVIGIHTNLRLCRQSGQTEKII
ncbi:hypothetical protein DY000_02041552 [Brassica cretica]|uniref:Uncharacterized protein n=1 Tax=Brassica cretica TaxID=69181 RepID=A0ABQ7BFB5_BRACR|nr:hypothetical protein DY000_02041552 [Brassica cretica]